MPSRAAPNSSFGVTRRCRIKIMLAYAFSRRVNLLYGLYTKHAGEARFRGVRTSTAGTTDVRCSVAASCAKMSCAAVIIYAVVSSAGGPGGMMHIVTLGNGTGQATLLRGLRAYACDVTAIVGVTDNGGHSGQLRRLLHLPQMGDTRQCLSALLEAQSVWGQLL